MNSQRRVLIIDDDPDFLIAMRLQLRGSYGVLTAQSVNEGLAILKERDVDLVLLDVGLERETGLEGIARIHGVHPTVPVAMLSGRRDVQTVVASIRAGAIDYLTKPIDMDKLTEVFEKGVAARSVRDRFEALESTIVRSKPSARIIYKGETMRGLIQEAERVREYDVNVLVVGETGTGKELFARLICEGGEGGRRPFVAVNCAAIPEHLLESELFGHESGAFTGATRRRVGKFELADGGSIFLDEVSTMKLELQVKLLRVLEEREFCRLGSNTPIRSNFRVVAACNQPLENLVEAGTFREDLYHRLKVVQITVPPLRDRTEDIPSLVDYFLRKYASGGEPKSIESGAMLKLIEYGWPGNVRELANVVRSLVIMSRGQVIDESNFASWLFTGRGFLNGNAKCVGVNGTTGGAPVNGNGARNGAVVPSTPETVESLREHVAQAEQRCIENALRAYNNDRTKTAEALGIGRTTLYAKMKEFGIAEKELV